MTALKVRANELQVGQQFKKSEAHFGTTTFECVGPLRRSLARRNEFDMEVKVIKSTGDYYGNKIGETVFITFSPRYNRFAKVALV